jgi:colicin import membrane protein
LRIRTFTIDTPQLQPQEQEQVIIMQSSIVVSAFGAPASEAASTSFGTMDFSMPSYGDAVGGKVDNTKDTAPAFANPFSEVSEAKQAESKQAAAEAKQAAAEAKQAAAAAKEEAAAKKVEEKAARRAAEAEKQKEAVARSNEKAKVRRIEPFRCC